MPTAATAVTGRLRIRPRIPAASAVRSRPGAKPTAAAGVASKPDSVTPMPDRAPASVHTSADSKVTLIPSRAARSRFSARARVATPTLVERRNQASAQSAEAATTMANTSGKPNGMWSPPTVNVDRANGSRRRT